MANFAAIQQMVKRVDKVIYTRKSKPSRVLEHDSVVTEQPLQINLQWHNQDAVAQSKVFAITMRSLGDDQFLILDLLFSEGVISDFTDIDSITPDSTADNTAQSNNAQARENSWQKRCWQKYHTLCHFLRGSLGKTLV